MTCRCYTAHDTRHRCRGHLNLEAQVEDWWVPAGECRLCLALEMEKLEHDLEALKDRWRNAMNPKQV